PGVPFSALVAEAETALAEARARGPFPTDLPSRQGSAPSGAVGPEGPPLALGIDLDPEAGDPVPPFAVSIPSDGGEPHLRIDPARLPPRTARALAGALRAFLADAQSRPDTPWSELELVDDDTRRRLLDDL